MNYLQDCRKRKRHWQPVVPSHRGTRRIHRRLSCSPQARLFERSYQVLPHPRVDLDPGQCAPWLSAPTLACRTRTPRMADTTTVQRRPPFLFFFSKAGWERFLPTCFTETEGPYLLLTRCRRTQVLWMHGRLRQFGSLPPSTVTHKQVHAKTCSSGLSVSLQAHSFIIGTDRITVRIATKDRLFNFYVSPYIIY